MHDEPDNTIDFDVECNSCRYNLRGLSPHGLCPECGSSIGPSLESHEKKKRSWFRRVAFRHRRALLGLHLVVGVFNLLVCFGTPLGLPGLWNFFVWTLVMFLNLLATALAAAVDKIAKANRDRLTEREYWFLLVAARVGYAPTVLVMAYCGTFLLSDLQ